MIKEDYKNPMMSSNIDIQLKEKDFEDMVLALTNIQREIFDYKKSK